MMCIKLTNYTHEEDVRTNIEIDDKLMKAAMKASGASTKRETVENALKLLIRMKHQQDIMKLRGAFQWEGDIDAMRREK
jgi:Arc/MetJ family transcription regulator